MTIPGGRSAALSGGTRHTSRLDWRYRRPPSLNPTPQGSSLRGCPGFFAVTPSSESMPTYEFRCPDGTIIERIFKMNDAPNEIPSPNGDGMAVRIISGGAGLLFKGTGFYITDYGKDGK